MKIAITFFLALILGSMNSWGQISSQKIDSIVDFTKIPNLTSSVDNIAGSRAVRKDGDSYYTPTTDSVVLLQITKFQDDIQNKTNNSNNSCVPPGPFSLISPGSGACTSSTPLNYQQSYTCNWQSSSGAVGYDIQVSQYPYGTAGSCGSSNNVVLELLCPNLQGTSATILANSLVPGMLYRWNVNAYSQCGNNSCKTNSSNILYFQATPEIGAYFGACCNFVSSPVTICSGNSVNITSTYFLNVNAPGTITYQWYNNGNLVQSGASDTYTATVSGTYTFKVTYSGSPCCGSAQSVASNGVVVVVTPLPGAATINGATNPCQGSNQNYSATASNATSYNWTVPSGWNINSGQGTANLNVTVGSSSGQVCATPSNSCGNGAAGCQSVSVIQLVGVATITGASNPCQGSSQSYTATSSNATSYNWTVPSGWTINSGQGTATLNVTVGSSSGQVCATPSNSCGSGAAGCKSVTVILLVGGATINGSANPCQGSSQSYTATASNATSYNWTVPSGWTINSGQGTANLNVTVGSSSGQVCATPSNACGNGAAGCQSVTVTQLVGTATINGSINPCQGSSQSYTATASNSTSYNWTVPSGWIINSGQGTSNLNVTVGANSGQVCALPSNICGSGVTGCQSVTVILLVGVATITGTTNPCQGSNQSYTANANNATSYDWTVPSGWSINSGQGTSTINVTVGSSSGQVCATPSNACGIGAAGCKTVSVTPLVGVATINGSTNPCQGANQSYSATSNNATSYNWTVPSGWIINSGQGTAIINVTVGSGSGQVCATPSNACGSGVAGCKTVSVSQLVGTMSISGLSNPCQGSNQNYSGTASNATSYNWTVPSGWTINSGQGTANINVTVSSGSGQVCATPSNACGSGVAVCQSVTVTQLVGVAIITGSTNPCQGSNQSYTATSNNAASYNWTVPSGWTINSGQGTANLNVTIGATSGQVCVTPSNSCGSGVAGCQPVTVTLLVGVATINGATNPCQGSSQSYSAIASNATSYNWTVPSGWTVNSGQGTANLNATIGASSGQVCATPSNSCGSGAAGCQSVVVNTPPTAPAVVANGSTSLCNGQSVVLNINNPCSGCTFLWSNGQTGASISVSQAGSYSASATNVCGTSGASNVITVTVGTPPAAPTIVANGSTSLCGGQNVGLSVNNPCGGCTFTWSNGQSGASITVSQVGDYSVSATNNCGTSGASNVISVTVGTPPAAPAIVANGSTSLCNGQNVVLSINNPCGGCTFSWSNGQTGASITVTQAGSYSVSATNACGTSGASNVIVVTVGIPPAAPTIVANGSTSLCNGQNVGLSVSNPCSGCTFSWSNGQTGNSITVSQVGNYSVSATNACGTSGASNIISVTVGTPPMTPAIVANGSTSLCNGQNVGLNINNPCSGCTFLWSNGQTGASITVNQIGDYSVSATNACGTSGASNVISVTVGQAPAAPAIVPNGSTSLCGGQGVGLSINNPCTGCTFLWSNGQTGASVTVNQIGDYSVSATNTCGTSGASNVISVTAGQPPVAPTIVPITSTSLCNGQNVALNVNNPCGGCTYLWSNGQTGTSITVSQAGNYSVSATNACGTSGASNVIVVTVGTPPDAPIIATSNNSLCQGQSAVLSVNSPCSGCSYLWSNGQTGNSIAVTQTGNYSVLASNACGTSVASNIITVTTGLPPVAPSIFAIGPTSICNGQSVVLSINNPCSGCTFTWSNGLTGTNITITQAGNYSVSATNSCGTSGPSNVIQVLNVNFVPVFQVNNNSHFAAPIGSNYQWYFQGQPIPGATGQFYNAEQIGYYTLTMTNLDGCVGTSGPIFVDVVGTAEEFQYGSVSIFPNPADQTIFIDITLFQEVDISIDVFSVDGRIIEQGLPKTLEGDVVKVAFDLSSVPPGLYYFLIRDFVSHSASAAKFVVVH